MVMAALQQCLRFLEGSKFSCELCPSPSGQKSTCFSTELPSFFLGREWRQPVAHVALGGGKLLGSTVPVHLSSEPSRRSVWVLVSPHKLALQHIPICSVVFECSVLSKIVLKVCMIDGISAKKIIK